MKVISKIGADLVRRPVTQYISASQFDANARAVAVTLTQDGQPWNPPANAVASVVFRNLQTGHKGRYDTMPDGSPACLTEGNVVTATLAPAVLASPGEVTAAIVFQDQDLKQIATFRFHIMVEENSESGEPAGNDYVNFTPGNIDDTTVGKQAWSSQRIQAELDVMRDQTDNLSANIDNLSANTEWRLAYLDETKAEIDDEKIGSDAWSSKNTVDKLCPSFSESGSAVRCEPVNGYPLEVTTELTDCSNAKLWHSGKNIFDVSAAGMYHSNSVSNQAVNNTVTETGVYMNPLTTLSNQSQRCGLYIGTVKELAGKTITVSAKVVTTIDMPWMLITATQIEPTSVRENPTYKDGGYLSSNASETLEKIKATDGFAKLTYTVTGSEDFPYISAVFYLGSTGAATTDDWTEWSDIQVEIGDTATAYEPYRGETYEKDFGEPVSGVYSWTEDTLWDEDGNEFAFADGPIEVLSLDGVNTIWCDNGRTTVKGRADPVAVIEKLTNAIIALGGNV